MTDDQNKNDSSESSCSTVSRGCTIAIGAGIGTAIGAGIGVPTGNLVLIGVGVAIGAGIGAIISRKKRCE